MAEILKCIQDLSVPLGNTSKVYGEELIQHLGKMEALHLGR
jgi:hypothetical protein